MVNYLNKINSPKDLKDLSFSDLKDLAAEIREVLLEEVSTSGGHLASNLGSVELIVALHKVYNSPEDKLIFDVGHQAYTHKLLTGRFGKISTMRKLGGLSGYLKRSESEHDAFGAGHVGTAVSAACGFAEANVLGNNKSNVVAVIGDGSLTNGLTFEGLNNIGEKKRNVTVVINDNGWSIAKNIGGIAKCLSGTSGSAEDLFASLGFQYYGPIDGHNIKELIEAFETAKQSNGPKVIHIMTKKGHGYKQAEQRPDKYHFTTPFNLETGERNNPTGSTYSGAMADALLELAEKDAKIVALTAAMPTGTGLDKFADKFPDRFFDVGIAESHAVVQAGSLAAEGYKPVFAVYSSFLQRGYDQIIHDIALQNLPVVFAVDRAGIVGNDGPTHHGEFDLAYLRSIPNLTVMAPKDADELKVMLTLALQEAKGPVAIRYPRGGYHNIAVKNDPLLSIQGGGEKLRSGRDLSIIAIGSMVYPSLQAAEKLAEMGVDAAVYNARFIKPIDRKMLKDAITTGRILTVEENVLEGGFGSAVLEALSDEGITGVKTSRIGISGFIEHGTVAELKSLSHLDSASIIDKSIKLINGGK